MLEAGAWYHVVNRGNNRQRVFKDTRDHEHFLEILAKGCASFKVELHAYVLMGNHYHMFVRTQEANLSTFMHYVQTSFVIWYNRRHEQSGHVFQDRYRAQIADKDGYGTAVSRYIHLNPFEQVKGQAVLGTETFVEKVRRFVRRHGVRDKAAQGSVRRVRARSVGEILAAVAEEYDVGVEALKRVRSGASAARRAALWALAEHGRGMLSLREIGEAMGGISASAVAQARQRHTAEMRQNRRIRRRSGRIANFIVNS